MKNTLVPWQAILIIIKNCTEFNEKQEILIKIIESRLTLHVMHTLHQITMTTSS